MPFSHKFQMGMGFPKEGQVVGGFTVESVSVSHVNIEGGHYEYPTEMIVNGEGSTSEVKNAFKEFFKARRTLFSGFGNPYQCRHGKMVVQRLEAGRFSITTQGVCIRVYLRPELERFIKHLNESRLIATGTDKAKWKTIIDNYMKEYEKSTSKANPFFS